MAGWDASGGEKAGTVGVLGAISSVAARQLGRDGGAAAWGAASMGLTPRASSLHSQGRAHGAGDGRADGAWG
jgi:hypothetical protein